MSADMIELIFLSGIVGIFAGLCRVILIQNFKISYYEQKLKNRDVDISSVKHITLTEIFKLD